jgi:hypothetical protein
MYSYRGLNFTEGVYEGLISWGWERITLNPAALRNRLKLMKREFALILNSIKTKPVKILSLASGSGRGVVEVLGEAKGKIEFAVTFVDRNPLAHDYCKILAKNEKIDGRASWVREDLSSFIAEKSNRIYDIVEMVGFFDYLDDEFAVSLLRRINSLLKDDGYLVAANVKNNPEKRFLNEIVNWKMVYRDENDLRRLLNISGFDANYCRIIYEPLNIHGLMIVKKC